MSNTHIFIILLRGCQGNKWKYRWKVDKILLKMEIIYRNSWLEPIFCKLRPDRRWTKKQAARLSGKIPSRRSAYRKFLFYF